jgi:hypothetical protein
MKRLLFVFTATAIFCASCNKGLEPPINKIYGLWQGTETKGGSDDITNVSFEFDGGSTLKYYRSHDIATTFSGTGTYTVVNNVLTATYVDGTTQPKHRTLKAYINDMGESFDGYYYQTENTSQKGIISVTLRR